VRQHIPNFGTFIVDLESFSAAKCSAWQLGHSKFIGPKECLSAGSLGMTIGGGGGGGEGGGEAGGEAGGVAGG
jgi:hypothetical protein